MWTYNARATALCVWSEAHKKIQAEDLNASALLRAEYFSVVVTVQSLSSSFLFPLASLLMHRLHSRTNELSTHLNFV